LMGYTSYVGREPSRKTIVTHFDISRDSDLVAERKTMGFVCAECVEAQKTGNYEDHCQRHDTRCDCQCRKTR
jgi:hypothetical protein